MTPITGNTYPVKEELRGLGGKWDGEKKAWMVPDDRAEEARALVAGAANAPRTPYRPTRCASCGAKASRYVRIYGRSDKTAKCSNCYRDDREEDN